jgi:hypothetical protein
MFLRGVKRGTFTEGAINEGSFIVLTTLISLMFSVLILWRRLFLASKMTKNLCENFVGFSFGKITMMVLMIVTMMMIISCNNGCCY